ncbi:MAG: tetratricopeptide repeat protein [Bryobacteraceae bacterium]|jgi:TPR repeat protein
MKWIGAFAWVAYSGMFPALGQDFDAGLRAYQNQDYAAALKEWRPLAEKGNTLAEFNVGLLYLDGKAVPQDFELAAEWFEKAADRGYTKAQGNLGEMYAIGQGVKKDFMQSYKWLSLCAAGGNQTCADHRDWVAKKLKGSQLAAAQRMTRDWKPKPGS